MVVALLLLLLVAAALLCLCRVLGSTYLVILCGWDVFGAQFKRNMLCCLHCFKMLVKVASGTPEVTNT